MKDLMVKIIRMKNITTAIIPVAGLGTRLLPLTKSVPKELLPVYDKPVIQYIVDEVVQAGIKKIIFVISAEKESIRDYFLPNEKLNKMLAERQKSDILSVLQTVETAAEFQFVFQSHPYGDGHALQQALPFVPEGESVVVLFGDDLVDNPGGQNAVEQLMEQYEKQASPVLLLQEVPLADTVRYGIVDWEDAQNRKIKQLVEKPIPAEAPSNLAVIGKYILTADVLQALANATVTDGELRLADILSEYLSNKKDVFGVPVRGVRFDTGQIKGLVEASHHFFVQGN
ncbi:UTP--glucose-1-phosphate uridylyltransferase [bacterium DOLZORAL124_38_8]|nr:MAG: UTP--glucose-1-phosphate uridylyltransferase [bacterium DOLZORAL124_38_8]